MRLAKASELLVAMGVGVNTGSEDNAARALDFSFPILENLLETTFRKSSHIDYFNHYNHYEYRLTKMFIDPDSVVVRESTDSLWLATPSAGAIVDPDDYYIDADKGLFTLRRAVLRGTHTVSVAYDYGLPEEDDDENVLVAPDWLKEAAIAAGLVVINTTPSIGPTSKGKASGNKQIDEVRLLLRQHLGNKLRPRMTVDYPSRDSSNE